MIDAVLERAAVCWPKLAWEHVRLDAYVAALDDPGVLASEHRDDLVWAWACLEGDADALAALESGPLGEARAHLGSLGFAAHAIDETSQRAFTKLVVDRALSRYRGRGPLEMFVRTTVVRLAIDDHRGERARTDLDQILAAPCIDPELEYMRKLYADQLVGAVRDAWAALAAHDRFVLSLRILDAMSIDDVARVYKIHRATAARRAAAARASLISGTRKCLRDRLSVGDATLDSILRIVTTSVQLAEDDAAIAR